MRLIFLILLTGFTLGQTVEKHPRPIKTVDTDSKVIAHRVYPSLHGQSAIGNPLLKYDAGYFRTLNTDVITTPLDQLAFYKPIVGNATSLSARMISPAKFGTTTVGNRANPFDFAYLKNVHSTRGYFDAVYTSTLNTTGDILVLQSIKTAKQQLSGNAFLPSLHGVATLGSKANPYLTGYINRVSANDVYSGSIATNDSYKLGSRKAELSTKSGIIGMQHHVQDYYSAVLDSGIFDRKYPLIPARDLKPHPGYVKKRGGIYSRHDDSNQRETMINMLAVYEKNAFPYTWGVNPGYSALQRTDVGRFRSEYDATIHDYSVAVFSPSVEIADHTPAHSTRYFYIPTGENPFKAADWGIDAVFANDVTDVYGTIYDQVFIETVFTGDQELFDQTTKPANIVAPNLLISQGNGAFSGIVESILISYGGNYYIVASQSLYSSYLLNNNPADPDTIVLEDFYLNDPGLSGATGVTYTAFNSQYALQPTVKGMRRLLQASKWWFNKLGLPYGRTWIQPGGTHPVVHSDTVRLAGLQEGYIGAATEWPTKARRTFNEDPNLAWAFQWSSPYDISSEVGPTLASMKTEIATAYAKNHFVAEKGHFEHDATARKNLDSLWVWVRQNNIPFLTMGEAINLLYHSEADPYDNILPPLYNDFDADGNPDGYSLTGTWETAEGTIETDGHSVSRSSAGQFFLIDNIGGGEAGFNDFSIAAKGASGTQITVNLNSNTGTSIDLRFTLSGTGDFEYFGQEDSDNGTTTIKMPADVVVVDVTVDLTNHVGGTVYVTDLQLQKLRR